MLKRKLWVLAAGLVAPAVFVASLSVAAPDEDSELHKLMEQVQAKNAAVLKGVRNKASFTKAQADVAGAAADLAKLGKQAKDRFKDVDKPAQPVAKWNELSDAYVKECEKFAEDVAKKDMTAEKAKVAYKAVQATCTSCHNVYRVEE